jgi:hypothetical protein
MLRQLSGCAGSGLLEQLLVVRLVQGELLIMLRSVALRP